ncbi:hypothetical protein SAMN04489812_2847 [Microlunatus soli]|uniref:Uncharacterized protein n=1 Tax=Microlunatus soli TaxID=630515 RepID=A0A1H1UM01_9ACTN|nr:hypothetical protein SAMN04489812_2847 [Microlunatus soli]
MIARRTSATPATVPAPSRLRACCLLLALLLGCLFAGPLTGPATARAETGSQVSIELTALTPAISDPNATITFEGKVTNTSDRPLDRLQAMIWRNMTPYTTQDELSQAGASQPTDPVGARMYSPGTPTAYQNLYTEDAPQLDPGASKTFRVRAKASDFFETTTPQPGVYLAGIQVRENASTTVGRARSYVVATAGDGLQPGQQAIGTSTIVELAATPSMSRSGIFTDDGLADQIGPGGRLDTLLRAAERPGASFAVDPNLLLELKSMKNGYSVIDADGAKTAGTGKDAAADWLTRFTALRQAHDGFQLLYARPDLTSLVHADRLGIVRDGQREAAKIAEVKGLPLLIAPADGAADRATLQAAKQLGAAAVLLDQADLGDLGPVISADDSPTILGYDSGAAAGPGPDPRDTEVQQRQTSLADSYVDSVSGEPASSLGRLRLVSDADQAVSANATLQAPWLKPRSVKDLLTDRATPLGNNLHYPDTVRAEEFNPRQLRRLDRLQQNLQTYSDLLGQSSADTLIGQSLPRAASLSWRRHRSEQSQFVRAQQQLLTAGERADPISLDDLESTDAIRVESNPQVTLTGSGARVPVTVVNELNSPIKVQLRANSSNQSRLRLQDVPAREVGDGTVDAGAKVPVQIPAQANANGDMQVTLQLATTEGQNVGEPLTIRVNATRAGLVGWIIAIAAGIVLLGTVVLRIRQVARERAAEEPEPAEDPGSTAQHGPAGHADPAQASTDRDEATEDTVIRPRRGSPDPSPDAADEHPEPLSTDGVPRG